MYDEKLEVNEILEMLQPKIKKELSQTFYQEREDLEQEILLKILEKEEKITSIKAPGINDFIMDS